MTDIRFNVEVYVKSPHEGTSAPLRTPQGKWEDLNGLRLFLSNANNRIPLSVPLVRCGFVSKNMYESLHQSDDLTVTISVRLVVVSSLSLSNQWELDHVTVDRSTCSTFRDAKMILYPSIINTLKKVGVAA